jgi:hypothetical protein
MRVFLFLTLVFSCLSSELNAQEEIIVIPLKAVQVSASKNKYELKTSQMSMKSISIEEMEILPSFVGERDLIKSLQLMPGIQAGRDGARMYVRGGGADQNLILLGGVPVFNASHLMGFFSVFNADAVEKVDIYTGGFPARFGGRLSSVIDVKLKQGCKDSLKGGYTIGILSSKAHVNGPMLNKGSSFNIAARGVFTDPFTKSINLTNKFDALSYRFFDINANFVFKISEYSKMSFFFYMGEDYASGDKTFERVEVDYFTDVRNEYRLDETNEMQWGNIVSAINWTSYINEELRFTSSIAYSHYNFSLFMDSHKTNLDNEKLSYYAFDYRSGIYDLRAKCALDIYLSDENFVKMGLEGIVHVFKPGMNTIQTGEMQTNYFYNEAVRANEYRAYIQNEFSLFTALRFNIGFHLSYISVQDTYYQSFEPRMSMALRMSENLSLKIAYSHMQQYVHLLSNSALSMPSDLWVPVTNTVKPMRAKQYALGALADWGRFSFSAEVFYKDMDNLIEYKEGTSFFGSVQAWDEKVVSGKGWSYGIELLLKKKYGKTTGWIGYTLSRSERLFDEINMGKVFPAKYDRRHDISLVLMHKPNKKIDFALTWVYGSGDAITLPNQKLALDLPVMPGAGSKANFATSFVSRNNYRVPDYHRLDIGVNFHKKTRRGKRTWNVSVFNFYNKQNALHLYPVSKELPDGSYKTVLKQVSLFSIMPSVSYIYSF